MGHPQPLDGPTGRLVLDEEIRLFPNESPGLVETPEDRTVESPEHGPGLRHLHRPIVVRTAPAFPFLVMASDAFLRPDEHFRNTLPGLRSCGEVLSSGISIAESITSLLVLPAIALAARSPHDRDEAENQLRPCRAVPDAKRGDPVTTGIGA